jgi:hypothetical protein
LAVAAALLTREQLILTVPLLYLPLLLRQRWCTLATALAIGIGPFAASQVALRIIWGKWALTSGDTQGAGVGKGILALPFHGLFDHGPQVQFGLILAFVVVPLLVACGVAALAMWHDARKVGWRGMLADPVPLFILAYTLLLSLTSWILWQDMWTPSRLAALPVVFGVLVAARLPRPQLRASYATLVAITSAAPLMLVMM